MKTEITLRNHCISSTWTYRSIFITLTALYHECYCHYGNWSAI